MSSHRRHGSTTSRSRNNTSSQPLAFSSISPSGGGTNVHATDSSTRYHFPVQSRSGSPRPGEQQQHSTSLPSAPLVPSSPIHPSPSNTLATPGTNPSPRARSQSSASISQVYTGAPTPLFAGPGGYYAYPFFAASPPGADPGQHDGGLGVGMEGLRASYSSPHLPYLFGPGGSTTSFSNRT